jgi:hypothetical protein
MSKSARMVSQMNLDITQALKRALMRQGVLLDTDIRKKPINSNQFGNSRDSASSSKKARSSDPDINSEVIEVHEKLIDITEKAQDVLFEADTVFPLTLFPDTITLDREKLTVATRAFFRTAKIVSVPVSSISSAEVDVGPFFASLHMASKFFVQNTYSVNYLKRRDAAKLHKLLQGFIIAQEKKIDVTDINKQDLCMLLEDLGQGVSD